MSISNTQVRKRRWQALALPSEHGAWGFVSEAILLGLVLSPTWAGLAVSIAAIAAFLLRQPLKIALKDFRAGRKAPRTLGAWRFAMIYGSIGILAGIVAFAIAPSLLWLVPIGLSSPLIIVQLRYELRNQGRQLIAEFAGVLASGAFAASIILMANWTLAAALLIWLALAVKGITAVLYVRARLSLERGKADMRKQVLAAHLAGIGVLLIAVAYGLLPWTVLVAMLILSLRAALGLSSLRKARPAKVIGMQELGYGLGYVLFIVVGYFLRLFC